MNPAAAVADVHHVSLSPLQVITGAETFSGKSAKLV